MHFVSLLGLESRHRSISTRHGRAEIGDLCSERRTFLRAAIVAAIAATCRHSRSLATDPLVMFTHRPGSPPLGHNQPSGAPVVSTKVFPLLKRSVPWVDRNAIRAVYYREGSCTSFHTTWPVFSRGWPGGEYPVRTDVGPELDAQASRRQGIVPYIRR